MYSDYEIKQKMDEWQGVQDLDPALMDQAQVRRVQFHREAWVRKAWAENPKVDLDTLEDYAREDEKSAVIQAAVGSLLKRGEYTRAEAVYDNPCDHKATRGNGTVTTWAERCLEDHKGYLRHLAEKNTLDDWKRLAVLIVDNPARAKRLLKGQRAGVRPTVAGLLNKAQDRVTEKAQELGVPEDISYYASEGWGGVPHTQRRLLQDFQQDVSRGKRALEGVS